MEIPVIVLDHQGEVAFWSKLAGASWVALDIWPDWNSQFKARKSLTVLEILPTHSALFLPLSISWYPSTFLPSLVPILSILKGTVASTRASNCHPLPVFPTVNKENKMHTKAPIHAVPKQDRQLHDHRTSTRKDNSKVTLWPGWESCKEDSWRTLRAYRLPAALPRRWVPPLKIRPACALWEVERIMTLCQWANTHTCINHPSCLAVNYSCLPSE